MSWLDDVGFVPLLDEELLRIRHALNDKAAALSDAGHKYDAERYTRLLEKLSGMQGQDYKISMLTDADREAIAA